jgi:hypothetical protein
MRTADTKAGVETSTADASGTSRRQASLRGQAARIRHLHWSVWVLLVILAGALALHGYNRGHTYIMPIDEAVHAIVAEHLEQHPLDPTLYEIGALSPQYETTTMVKSPVWIWTLTHTWLHIPPFGMWAAAISMHLFGNTPGAFRLPGLLFVLAGIATTYLIGRKLFGSFVGLCGAAFVAFAPWPLFMSQGYYFGDLTDTPLMCFTPLAVLGLVWAYRSGRYRWLLLAGFAQGVCYLSKGGLGLAPTGVMLGLFACEWLFPPEDGWRRLGARGLATYLGALLLTAGPYNLYLARAFPAAFAGEQQVWRENIMGAAEGWGRPFDYHLTAYLYDLYGAPLALLLLTAALTVAALSLLRRSRADAVIILWIATLYLPLSLIETKTVSYMYPAVPAIGLAVGRLVSAGISARSQLARAGTMAVLLVTVASYWLLAHYWLGDPRMLTSHLYRLHPYLVELGACCIALPLCAGALWLARRYGPSLRRWLGLHLGNLAERLREGWLERAAAGIVVALALIVVGQRWVSVDVVEITQRTEYVVGPWQQVGAYLEAHTPVNATILLPQGTAVNDAYRRLPVMFWAHRDVYYTTDTSTQTICSLAQRTRAVGSPLYYLAPTSPPALSAAGMVLGGTEGWTLLLPACGSAA